MGIYYQRKRPFCNASTSHFHLHVALPFSPSLSFSLSNTSTHTRTFIHTPAELEKGMTICVICPREPVEEGNRVAKSKEKRALLRTAAQKEVNDHRTHHTPVGKGFTVDGTARKLPTNAGHQTQITVRWVAACTAAGGSSLLTRIFLSHPRSQARRSARREKKNSATTISARTHNTGKREHTQPHAHTLSRTRDTGHGDVCRPFAWQGNTRQIKLLFVPRSGPDL